MVSVHPNPPPGQDCTPFYGYYMGGDPMGTSGMKTTEDNGFLETSSCWNAVAAVEDCRKKVRKPYTITKSRESWTEEEHDKFLEALHLFDRDWKKIEAFVGSKTVIQIRSHAQKYFLKIQKNGTSEHVPPPRPKRKAAHPYPQKAPKHGPLQPSAALPEPQYNVGPDSMSMPRNPVGGAPFYPSTYMGVQTGYASCISQDDFGSSGITMSHNRSSNINENAPRKWISNDANSQVKEKQCTEARVMPDFAQVYSFIGSIFDPSANDQLQRLRKMEPVNVETVLMLMKNLSVNLVSPEFLKHRRLLSRYSDGIENDSKASKISV